jgi:hypothetical protein
MKFCRSDINRGTGWAQTYSLNKLVNLFSIIWHSCTIAIDFIRKRKATADVKSTIETTDLKQCESLESPRLGLYAKVVQGEQSRLNKDALQVIGER